MVNWKHLPEEMVILIGQKLDFLQDFTRLSAACKPWRSALSDQLQFCGPWLLLAEDTDLDLSATRVSHAEATNGLEYLDYIGGDFIEDDQTTEIDRIIKHSIEYLFKNTSSVRGLYSLATKKVYNLDLPEATDRLILATSNGWLVTIGRDLEINLLHPLSKHQIPLPSMLALPIDISTYNDNFPPQEEYTKIISKVVMASNIHEDGNYLPMIMAIYGDSTKLAFARIGDELWTDIKTNERFFQDIVYHKEKFYAIDFDGQILVCDTDKQVDFITYLTHFNGNQNYAIEYKDDCASSYGTRYLIESLSGSHIWVVIRCRKGEYCGSENIRSGELRYYTSDFVIFKLEVQYSTCGANPSYKWTIIKDLGNETLFIGRASSKSVASSKSIKSNSIYFTDDNRFLFHGAGGHDMGIFDVKSGTIQPHYEGISIHPFSPPLWYF